MRGWRRGVVISLAVPAVAWAQAPVITSQGDPSINDSVIYAGAVTRSAYPNEDYVLLLDDGVIRVDDDGRRHATYRQVIQVLTQQGAEAWGELSFRYDADRTTLTVNWLRVVGPSGAVASDGPVHQQEGPPEVSFDAPVYTDARVRRMTVGGMQPGAILDVSVTYETHRPPYASDFYYHWYFDQGAVVRRSRFLVDLPRDVPYRIRALNAERFPLRETTPNGRRVLEWNVDAIPAVEWEVLAGWPNDVVGSVTVSSALPWDSIAAWYDGLSRDRYAISPEVRAEVTKQLDGARSERDSIEATHRWVAQDFRYVSLSLGDGGHRPRLPSDVVKTAFGDCKDKTTLFVALLRDLGIDASPVLVTSDGGLDTLAPTMLAFDHMIAAVETSRGREFADLTMDLLRFGQLPWELHGEPGLLVRPDGSAEMVTLPQTDPDDSLLRAIVEGTLAADGSFDGAIAVTATGLEELGLRERVGDTRDWDDEDVLDLGQSLARSYFDRAVTDSAIVSNGAALSETPTVVVWLRVPNLVTRSGRNRVLPLPLPDYSMPAVLEELESDTLRRFPIDVEEFNGPTRHRTEIVVALPPGWRADLPPDVDVDGTFGHYRASYDQQGRTVLVTRELAGRWGTAPPDSAGALAAWIRAVGDDYVQFLVLEEAADAASTDSLAAVERVTLPFGWPVGMEAVVFERSMTVRNLSADGPDTTVVESPFRLSVGDHASGRRIVHVPMPSARTGDAPPALAVPTGALPPYLVDAEGTFLGFEDLRAFIDPLRGAVRERLDAIASGAGGVETLMERMLSPGYLEALAQEFWNPLVYAWSEAELEVGVDYLSENDVPSPVFPDRLIRSENVHRLDAWVPCRTGETDSACVRLLLTARTEPEGARAVMAQFFDELLLERAAAFPTIDTMVLVNEYELVAEPATLIPHRLVARQEMSITATDTAGQRQVFGQRQERDYRFAYGVPRTEDEAPPAALLDAVASGDLPAATRALEAGESLERRGPEAQTPLIIAAAQGHEALVDLLLTRGARTASTDAQGRSALVWAALGGYDEILDRLVAAGGDLDRAYRVVRSQGLVRAVPPLLRAGAAGPTLTSDALLDRGHAALVDGDVAAALPWYLDAYIADTTRMDALAWLAEALWRRGRHEEAAEIGHLVLAREPCQTHALGVVGATHRAGRRPGASPDSAWHYFTAAVRCDADDGNAWLDLALAAAERGDAATERDALRRLKDTGLLTPADLAWARWFLESLPPDALVLVTGDVYTFGLLAVQAAEGRRRDVAVVNRWMLELPWYRELVIDRFTLPRPDRLADAVAAWAASGSAHQPVTASDTALVAWRAAALDGRLDRPVALAVAMGGVGELPGPGMVWPQGPYALVVDSAPLPDPARLLARYKALDPSAFVGSSASPVDRSPVRQRARADFTTWIGYGALMPLTVLSSDEWMKMDTTALRGVQQLLEWTVQFVEETDPSYRDGILAAVAEEFVDAGWAVGRYGDRRGAVALHRRANGLAPGYPVALMNIGYHSLLLGDLDTAVAYLERARSNGASLGILQNLVDANRLLGDLDAARRYTAEAERLAVGERLTDRAVMGAGWTFDYLPTAGADGAWRIVDVRESEVNEKLAMVQYWAAITEAAAGEPATARERLARARELSRRTDLLCVVHNRIDAMVERHADRADLVAGLRALAGELEARDTVCARPR